MYASELRAAPNIGIKPVPSWVVPVTPGGKPAGAKDFSNGYYIAFSDIQTNLDEQTTYRRVIRQIVSESGVQNGSEIFIGFDPSYEHLSIHSLVVWRDGVAASRLNLVDFKVIPVESDRQRFIYNGFHTASVILKDIRKGDRIELAYSLTGWNPVFKGKYSDVFNFATNDYVGHIHAAVVAKAGRTVYIKDFNKPPTRKEKTVNGLRVYEWDARSVRRIHYDEDVPGWYDETPTVQVTEFKSWQEVVDWGLNFYSIPIVSGPLKAKVEEWKRTSETRLDYIEKAVRFVQDDVRYLGIETGENSHRPHKPEDVFNQRYGDCKDKTFLLCAILNANGIEAAPVLVDTYKRSRLADYLPSPADFNHVVARVLMHDLESRRPEARDYVFIDATMSLQGGAIPQTYFPAYGHGLLLKAGEKKLLHMQTQNPGSTEITEDFYLPTMDDTASTGMLQVKTVYFNHDAETFRSTLQESVVSELEDTYFNFYSELYKNTRFERHDSLEFYDQRAANNVSVVERYQMKNAWQKDEITMDWYFQMLGRIMYDHVRVLPARKRKSPVFLNYPTHIIYKARVHFSDNRGVPVDHWNVERVAYDISFKSEFLPDEKVWELTYVYKTKQDHVPVDQIEQYREDIEKLSGYLEQRVDDTSSSLISWSGTNGWMLLLAFLTMGGCFLAARKFESYSPGPRFHAPAASKNGWLILIGIGIVAASLLLPLGLMTAEAGSFFTDAEWYRMDGTTEMRIVAYHLFLILQCIFYVGLWCYSVFLWRLYFKKRDSFPMIYSGFLSINLVFSILVIILNYSFSIPQEANAFAGIPVQILWAAGLTSYMYKSASVKRTFVNTYDDQMGVSDLGEEEMMEIAE
jgi:transglutaminase-like putative cysteine protease